VGEWGCECTAVEDLLPFSPSPFLPFSFSPTLPLPHSLKSIALSSFCSILDLVHFESDCGVSDAILIRECPSNVTSIRAVTPL
jgi:hypothetical protein